jgi:hypothetical protein
MSAASGSVGDIIFMCLVVKDKETRGAWRYAGWWLDFLVDDAGVALPNLKHTMYW